MHATGFEPAHLSIMEPYSIALTARPNVRVTSLTQSRLSTPHDLAPAGSISVATAAPTTVTNIIHSEPARNAVLEGRVNDCISFVSTSWDTLRSPTNARAWRLQERMSSCSNACRSPQVAPRNSSAGPQPPGHARKAGNSTRVMASVNDSLSSPPTARGA
jgi:hypothetical protein